MEIGKQKCIGGAGLHVEKASTTSGIRHLASGIRQFPLGPLQANCYLVWCPRTCEAVVIDPGYDPTPVIETVERGHLRVVRILCTHGHFDHISGVHELRRYTGAPFMVSEADADWCKNPPAVEAELFGYSVVPIPPDALLDDGDIVEVGSLRFRCIATPGHSPGGMCFLVGEQGTTLHAPRSTLYAPNPTPHSLFSGDTLFAGSVGRTDLPGGDWEQLMRSLEKCVLTLPDDLAVYPGHGPTTTIGAERRMNPFLQM